MAAMYRIIAKLSGQSGPVQSDESAFRGWYDSMSRAHDLNPDPDSQEQHYDYRAAFRAGAEPDAGGHWPSDYKQPGHHNMVVGGFNTKTGERVPGTRRVNKQGLISLGWDPATADRLSRLPEPK